MQLWSKSLKTIFKNKNKKSGPYNNGIISNRWTEEVDQVNKWLLINHSLNIISQLSSSLLQN